MSEDKRLPTAIQVFKCRKCMGSNVAECTFSLVLYGRLEPNYGVDKKFKCPTSNSGYAEFREIETSPIKFKENI